MEKTQETEKYRMLEVLCGSLLEHFCFLVHKLLGFSLKGKKRDGLILKSPTFPAGKGNVKTTIILKTPEPISSHLRSSFAKNYRITTLKEGDYNSAIKFLLQNPY